MIRSILFSGFGVLFFFLGGWLASSGPASAQLLTLQQFETVKSYDCNCWCGGGIRVICEFEFCAPSLIPSCSKMFRDDCSDSGFGGQCSDFYTWCDAACETR